MVCVEEDRITPAGVTVSVRLAMTAAVTRTPSAQQQLQPLVWQIVTQSKHRHTQQLYIVCLAPAQGGVVVDQMLTAGVTRCVRSPEIVAVTWRKYAVPTLSLTLSL